MHIERFDPEADEARTQACYRAYLDSVQVDDPRSPPMSPRAFTGWLACGWTEDHPQAWFAGRSPGDADGRYTDGWYTDGWYTDGWYTVAMPRRENRHLAQVYLQVPPARRRSGAGTALLRHAAAVAAAAGRTTLAGDARDAAAGAAFARALGARRGVTEVRRVLDLTALPPGTLARLRAEAGRAAGGYRLLPWEGTLPEEHLGHLAVVYAAIGDAPHDAGTEAQVWDADRVRAGQRRITLQGQHYYTLAAQPAGSREFAGLTQLAVDPESPQWGFQELTAVTRPHRGHRLGLMLKVAMLDLLAEREPQLRWVITGNADANAHMIAINTRLGFQPFDSWASWQLDVPQVLKPPGAAVEAGQS
jgi:GNAT superfamily N-acetyltransferase